jgi:hypothetical protein
MDCEKAGKATLMAMRLGKPHDAECSVQRICVAGGRQHGPREVEYGDAQTGGRKREGSAERTRFTNRFLSFARTTAAHNNTATTTSDSQFFTFFVGSTLRQANWNLKKASQPYGRPVALLSKKMNALICVSSLLPPSA